MQWQQKETVPLLHVSILLQMDYALEHYYTTGAINYPNGFYPSPKWIMHLSTKKAKPAQKVNQVSILLQMDYALELALLIVICILVKSFQFFFKWIMHWSYYGIPG